MILYRLTREGLAANNPPMVETKPARPGSGRRAARAVVMLMAGLAGSACVSVNAPDKPIVIELNINIKQEVIYRLAEDVRSNIEANPEIF
jgi:hypothetical protein